MGLEPSQPERSALGYGNSKIAKTEDGMSFQKNFGSVVNAKGRFSLSSVKLKPQLQSLSRCNGLRILSFIRRRIAHVGVGLRLPFGIPPGRGPCAQKNLSVSGKAHS